MSVLAEISIFPVGGVDSVSPYVARAVNIIRKSGLAYQLGPMGTCLEGEWDEVMAVVSECFKDMSKDSNRIYMTMKVDWREGRVDAINAKPRSVEEKL